MKTIALEGNLASGKSTLLDQVAMHLPASTDVCILTEPVDMFESYKQHNPLKLLYENPKKNAYFAQHHIINCVANQLNSCLSLHSPDILLSERSLFSPILFTNTLYALNYLEDYEKEKLLEFSDTVQEKHHIRDYKVDKVFFIKAPAEVCMERIKLRGRTGEENITVQYLRQLEFEYDKYIAEFAETNGQTSLRSVNHSDKDILDLLLEFIHNE